MLNSQQFLFVNHYRKKFEIVITIKTHFIAQMVIECNDITIFIYQPGKKVNER